MDTSKDTSINKADHRTEDLEFDPSFTPEQKEYFLNLYPQISIVKTERLHCTSCDVHLGSNTLGNTFVHPLLQVLLCGPCLSFYNSGEFQKGEDGSELHCRWCGQGGQVYCCSNCPTVFCKPCIKKNFNRSMIKMINDCDEWSCFRCDSKPLWAIQARCWALTNFLRLEKRACEDLDVTNYRKQQSFLDHSLCCKSRNLGDKLDLNKEGKLRKRSSSLLGNNKSESLINNKRAKSSYNQNISYKMDTEEEHEVVCTPDIFSCFSDNSYEPDVIEELPKVNGTNETPIRKPRISVRPPESLLQSPDQPMFQGLVQNQLLLCPAPGPSEIATMPEALLPHENVMPKGNEITQGNSMPHGNVLSHVNAMSHRNVYPPKRTYSNVKYKIVPMKRKILPNIPPPLVQINQNARNISQTDISNINQAVSYQPSPSSAQSSQDNSQQINENQSNNVVIKSLNKSANKTILQMVSNNTNANNASYSINTNTNTANKNKPTNEPTLSVLLQKKLKANPNINNIKLQKIPDWFYTNAQSCLVIAYNFVSQLVDLQGKARKVHGCGYDEVKNMHVQLSFFISALIGKLKSNQSDLNVQLSDWIDSLSTSTDELVSEPTVEQPAVNTHIQRSSESTAAINRQCRLDFKDIFENFQHDKKLNMDPIVSVTKFKFHKSTNVFKVKPKAKQIIKTPRIDPNVIQTIDSDSDDDCQIVTESTGTVSTVNANKCEIVQDKKSETNAVVISNEITNKSGHPSEKVNKSNSISQAPKETENEIVQSSTSESHADNDDNTIKNKSDDESNYNSQTDVEIEKHTSESSKNINKEKNASDKIKLSENEINSESSKDSNLDTQSSDTLKVDESLNHNTCDNKNKASENLLNSEGNISSTDSVKSISNNTTLNSSNTNQQAPDDIVESNATNTNIDEKSEEETIRNIKNFIECNANINIDQDNSLNNSINIEKPNELENNHE